MALVSSIVIWTGEPFNGIRAAVESCVHLDDAVQQSGVFGTRYTSVLTTVLQNTEDPHVKQWAEAFTQRCDARGLDFSAVRFDPADPMQTLSSGKQHLLSSSLRYLGDRVILHDIPLDRALASWAVRQFLSIGWPTDDCLVVVTTPPDGAIHLAFCTSREAYLEMGLLMFDVADYRALGRISIATLHDLCCLMKSAAHRNGWGVKELRWPPPALGSWRSHPFRTFVVASVLWGAGVFGPEVPLLSFLAAFGIPLVSAACVVVMWRQKVRLWRISLAMLLFLPQAALWFVVVLNTVLGYLG